jgi:hypothetical protein
MAYRLGAAPSTQRKQYPVLEINADGQTWTYHLHVPPQASSDGAPAPKRGFFFDEPVNNHNLFV